MTPLGAPGNSAQPAYSVERQIMWDRLLAIVEEQAQTILRTAFSSTVSDAGDLSAGVFDCTGRMLAQAATGTPGHVNSMAQSVGHFLERFPLTSMHEGDVYITNDPWLATGHLHDFTVVTPAYLDSRPVALFASTCHVVDIGGRGFGADAGEIYEEGLAIPPLRLAHRGELNETLLQLIRANVREPMLVEGDLHSLIACNERGSRRLCEMMREFNQHSLEALAEQIITTSRDAMLREIGTLPPGKYAHVTHAEGFEKPLTLAATLSVDANGIHVDFEGTSGCSAFGVNVPMSYTAAYASYGIRCLVGARIPNNAGSLGTITVSAPSGCILNAQRPVAVAARGVIGHMIPDLMFGCLHAAGVSSAPAESCSCIWGPMLYGRSGDHRFAIVNVYAGGMGARAHRDGLSATGFPSGVRCTPVEIIESRSPLVVWRKELRQDSGGPGRYRGGLGQTMEFGHIDGEAFTLSAMFERVQNPAAGRGGGHAGAAGRVATNTGRKLGSKGTQSVGANERLVLEIPGGGGVGSPVERDVTLVAEDVREGRVSAEAAVREYGVAILSSGEVNTAVTRRVRT